MPAVDDIPDLSGALEPFAGVPPNQNVVADINEQLGALVAGVERLSAKAQEKVAAGSGGTPSLEAMQQQMLRNEQARPKRTALANLDAIAFDEHTTIFTEFDDLVLSGDVDLALLGEGRREADIALLDRDARLAALSALRLSMDDAAKALEAAGVRMRDDFVDFAEMCAVKRVRLLVLAKGMKPLIRLLLREQGLGHVEVLAHDLHVTADNEWKVSLRDGSPSGHDKAESVRRALKTATTKAKATLQVGAHACDLAPASAGHVDCLLAPDGSALAAAAKAAGVEYSAFEGWGALTARVMGQK